MNSKMNIFSLSWPIFIEYLLRMLLGNISTFVLSRYSDQAVAAVGVANQLMSILLILFNVIGFGTTILVSQYLGAKDQLSASRVGAIAISTNALLGLVIGTLFTIFSKVLLRLVNLPDELIPLAYQYLFIVALFSFTQALLATMSALMRSYGHTKISMSVTVGMNILNVIGCYISIFRPFGIPILGIKGVAISLVISECIAVVIMFIVVKKSLNLELDIRKIVPFPKELLRDILKIGIPSAGEHLSYSMSQIATTSIISIIGTQALTTNVYCQSLTSFTKILGYSIGAGSQILIGYLIGSNNIEKAYKSCFTYLKAGLLMNLGMALIFTLFRKQLMGLFTSDPSIIAIGSSLIMMTVFLDTGRSFNSVIISCLRGSGDVRFPVIMGIISMWGVSVTLSYILGIYFNLGLLGVWIAFSVDEWLRGLTMLLRWQSKSWQKLSKFSTEDLDLAS